MKKDLAEVKAYAEAMADSNRARDAYVNKEQDKFFHQLNRQHVMETGLWSASPLSKPSTQMTIGSLFNMVSVGLKPLTGLLGLIGYLRVVSWSIGKAGGGSRDGLRGHRVKGMLVTYI